MGLQIGGPSAPGEESDVVSRPGHMGGENRAERAGSKDGDLHDGGVVRHKPRHNWRVVKRIKDSEANGNTSVCTANNVIS